MTSPIASAPPPPATPPTPPATSRVIVFLKAPRPGHVKTRLAAALDDDAAAAIYRVLIERTLAALKPFPGVELRHTPADAADEVRPWLRQDWHLADQGDGTLGDRLLRAAREASSAGVTRLVLVGTDCPGLTTADIDEAFDRLEDHDVVLGPALDGGYWLIALRQPEPALFHDIPWSTPGVFHATLERARAAGLRVHVLRTLRDVDTLEDWRAWLRPVRP